MVRISTTEGEGGATGQRRALERCRSEGYRGIGDVVLKGLCRGRVGTGRCGVRSSNWEVGAKACGGVAAPGRCGCCINTGAPIMLLIYAGLKMGG